MDVVCPACNEQHRVGEQMAGKRAKCGCGHIMTIPAVATSEPATDDWLNEHFDATGTQNPASGQADTSGAGPILFQCEYGVVRLWIWGLLSLNLLLSVGAIWIGFFWNRGWRMNNVRIPPIAATVIFEILGIGMLGFLIWFLVGYFIRLNHPRRVAVTAAGVILPKGHWSTAERFLPWAAVKVRFMDTGPIQQLQFKRGWRSLKVLVSTQFTHNEHFETICNYMHQHGKL